MGKDEQVDESKVQETQETDWKALYEQSRADLEKAKAASRKWEARSKENAGAAKGLEDAEGHAKDLEARIAAIEAENASLKKSSLRAKAAEKYGVPASLVSGDTEEEMEANAKAIAEFAKPKTAPRVSGAGSFERKPAGDAGDDDERRAFVRKLLGRDQQ